jgi:carbon-monoxide dehydrogenase medium subunit
MPHPASGFAIVGVAANLSFNGGSECKSARIGITGVSSKAYRATGVEGALAGTNLDAGAITAASAHATDGVDVNGDVFASDDYRRHLAAVYTRRAIDGAIQNAG